MGEKNNKIKELVSLEKKEVVIANVVTRAAQSLSLSEKRIIFASIAKLGGRHREVALRADEYADTFQMTRQAAYMQMKAAADNLFNRYLTWQVRDGLAIGQRRARWVGSIDYFDGEGYLKLQFTDAVSPYLFEVKKEFTKYRLDQTVALRSFYSWRLLELFEQYADSSGAGWLHIDLEEFWHAMQAKESYKTNFTLLRQRIVEPAVKELVQKGGWIIAWKPVKQGRRIAALKFEFEKNPQLDLFMS